MNNKLFRFVAPLLLLFLTACASVPMATLEEDATRKAFVAPSEGKSGIYIYRNSNFGGALKKSISINSVAVGQTAPMTYFYTEVEPGNQDIATESEFSDNNLLITTEADKLYFVKQSIKMGVFVGGAKLTQVEDDVGKKGVLQCNMATNPYR